MEAFFGSWQLCQKKNFDEYLKAIGNKTDFKSDAFKSIETIHKDGDYVVWTIKNSLCSRDMRFKLNEAFAEEREDGRLCQSAMSLKAGHLVQIQLWNRSEATIVREVKDKNMIVKMKCHGVEAECIYEKV